MLLCVLILYISGGTYSLKSTPNDRFFEKLFIAILFLCIRRVFARNLLRENHRRNTFVFCFDAWPGARTLALNPIENLWHDVEKRIDRSNGTNFNILGTEIQKAWYPITVERCQSLILSMHSRCTAVAKNNGFPSKYCINRFKFI